MILRTVFESTKLLRNINVSESRRGVKSLVDIPWVRPIRPPCNASGPDGSGDLVRLTPLPPTVPAPLFKEAKSLEEYVIGVVSL